MNNYAFKSEEDFNLKREDILILRKKVKDRINYIMQTALNILDAKTVKTEIYRSGDVYLTTDALFFINDYEDDCGIESYLSYHFDIDIDKNLLFKDKSNMEMDLRSRIPTRWLYEKFEEELKNGLYIKKDEVLEKLIQEKEFVENLANSLNLSEEQLKILGISDKLEQVRHNIQYYHY